MKKKNKNKIKNYVKSSETVIARKGRVGLISHELTTLLCPVISPQDEPESAKNACPNLFFFKKKKGKNK